MADQKQGAYMTVILRENDKEDPTKFAINKLAEIMSGLETRISEIEKILLGKTYKRQIRVVKEDAN